MTTKSDYSDFVQNGDFNIGDIVYANNSDGTITIFGVVKVYPERKSCDIVVLFEPRAEATRKIMGMHTGINFFQLKKFYGTITIEST